MPDLNELLARQCYQAGGTKVINCVIHMGLKLTERPLSCQLCACDVQNRLSDAIAVNEWLNQWKDDASEVLRRQVEQEGPRSCLNCGGPPDFIVDGILQTVCRYCAERNPATT